MLVIRDVMHIELQNLCCFIHSGYFIHFAFPRSTPGPAVPGEGWFLGVLVSGVRVPAFRVKERSICDHLAADFGVKRSRSRSCFPFLATSRRTCSLSQNFFNCDRRAA